MNPYTDVYGSTVPDTPEETREAAQYSADLRRTLDEIAELEEELLDRQARFALAYFDPHPKQQQFISARPKRRTRVFQGGNQCGKTTVGACELVAHMLGYRPWLPKDHPDYHVRILDAEGNWTPIKTPTTVVACASTFSAVRRIMLPRLFGDPDKQVPGFLPQYPGKKIETRTNPDGVINYIKEPVSGSECHFLTYDQKPKNYEGWTIDALWFDEPVDRNRFVAGQRGLLARLGNLWITATLLEEPWIKTELIDNPDVATVKASTRDNVGYGMSQAGLDQWVATLDPDERESRLDGNPSFLTGRVYKSFARPVHILSRTNVRLDRDWPWWMHLDTHGRKAHIAVWCCIRPDNSIVAAGELSSVPTQEGDHLIEDFRMAILNYEAEVLGIMSHRVRRLIDAYSQVSTGTGSTVLRELQAHGMHFKIGSKNRDTGIHLMRQRLHFNKAAGIAPSFYILDDMPKSLAEFENYVYDEHVGRNVEARMGKKEVPRKIYDDCLEGYHRILLEKPRFHSVAMQMDEDRRTNYRPRSVGTSFGY